MAVRTSSGMLSPATNSRRRGAAAESAALPRTRTAASCTGVSRCFFRWCRGWVGFHQLLPALRTKRKPHGRDDDLRCTKQSTACAAIPVVTHARAKSRSVLRSAFLMTHMSSAQSKSKLDNVRAAEARTTRVSSAGQSTPEQRPIHDRWRPGPPRRRRGRWCRSGQCSRARGF